VSSSWIHAQNQIPRRALLLASLIGVLASAHTCANPSATDAAPNAAPNAGNDAAQDANSYVTQALRSNLALQQQALNLVAATAALAEARARWRPNLSLSARYSRAKGGREIEFPLAELLNPVYQTLNQQLVAQGQPARFPALENQSFELLREREQDSRLSLIQPLYAPALSAAIRASEAGLAAQEAALDAFQRVLVRDVKHAYYGWQSARQALAIVASSQDVLAENRRVNQSLFDNGKVTRDQVLRAEAELLALQQQEREARNQVDAARNYLSFLTELKMGQELPEPATLPEQVPPVAELSAVLRRAMRDRPELGQVNSGVRAREAEVEIAQADYRPTLAFALDAGIQGSSYGFGSGQNFAVGSLVLNWKLFDGGVRRAQVSAAAAKRDAASIRATEVLRQIELEVRQALDDYNAARDSLETARARVAAASATLEIAARKRDAGSISQVEYLDARNTLTQAELNFNLTRFDVWSRYATLRYASGEPVPALHASAQGELP